MMLWSQSLLMSCYHQLYTCKPQEVRILHDHTYFVLRLIPYAEYL